MSPWTWRLLGSELRVTLHELRTSWTVRDLVDAHRWLDALEAAAEIMQEDDDR